MMERWLDEELDMTYLKVFLYYDMPFSSRRRRTFPGEGQGLFQFFTLEQLVQNRSRHIYSLELERRKRGGETGKERGKAMRAYNLNLNYLCKALSLIYCLFETSLEDDDIWRFELGFRVVLQIKTQDTKVNQNFRKLRDIFLSMFCTMFERHSYLKICC